jgi:hypothetical protein
MKNISHRRAPAGASSGSGPAGTSATHYGANSASYSGPPSGTYSGPYSGSHSGSHAGAFSPSIAPSPTRQSQGLAQRQVAHHRQSRHTHRGGDGDGDGGGGGEEAYDDDENNGSDDEEAGNNNNYEDYSSEEEEDSSGKNKSNRDTLKLYVLSVLVVLFCISYLYERDLRFKLIHEFNDSIDHASTQLYEARQKMTTSSAGSACPECAKCPDFTDIPIEDKPITETDLVLDSWKARDTAIVTELQNLARDILILKYGPPPYFVEVEVEIDSEKNIEGGKLVLEMAPVEHVPYSILFFLNQISAKAWDQCSFFINLGVVYTEDARGSEGRCNKANFRLNNPFGSSSREFLAFQEYSPSVRHEELTIGINGRPGGLGFYINAQV